MSFIAPVLLLTALLPGKKIRTNSLGRSLSNMDDREPRRGGDSTNFTSSPNDSSQLWGEWRSVSKDLCCDSHDLCMIYETVKNKFSSLGSIEAAFLKDEASQVSRNNGPKTNSKKSRIMLCAIEKLISTMPRRCHGVPSGCLGAGQRSKVYIYTIHLQYTLDMTPIPPSN